MIQIEKITKTNYSLVFKLIKVLRNDINLATTAEKTLPARAFVRIHKSYIVATNKIKSNRVKIADQLLPISDTYKEHFFETLRSSRNLL